MLEHLAARITAEEDVVAKIHQLREEMLINPSTFEHFRVLYGIAHSGATSIFPPDSAKLNNSVWKKNVSKAKFHILIDSEEDFV